jgi:hypothetical protein
MLGRFDKFAFEAAVATQTKPLAKARACVILVSVWKVGQVSIPAYSAAAMESRPTEFPGQELY